MRKMMKIAAVVIAYTTITSAIVLTNDTAPFVMIEYALKMIENGIHQFFLIHCLIVISIRCLMR